MSYYFLVVSAMKSEDQRQHSLYLEVSFDDDDDDDEPSIPLRTSIVLFLISYCKSNYFKVFLVSARPIIAHTLENHVIVASDFSVVQLEDVPALARGCRLPVVLDETEMHCRAGLAVVLRHIIDKTMEADPSRKDVLELLGFKKTCLKACAEVSHWTRLCEIGIPCAVEEHLQNPTDPSLHLPEAILHLEKRLGEPVKVHNDDKIRRQKLREQKQQQNKKKHCKEAEEKQATEAGESLELRAALAKLSVEDAVLSPATREHCEIRKVRTADLPPLEHVFAEGLYFTLTDVVLLPCIYHYLVMTTASLSRLPLLLGWYRRVQEVPGILAASQAGGASEEVVEKSSEVAFIGGPRPTMTKLKEQAIEAVYSPHPGAMRTLPWESFPGAVNPTEGKMSADRALRKRQQLNNLVGMVTELARPGDTIVDFCSGGGHVGLVLAHTLPGCQVILIENKEESLDKARARGKELGLANLRLIQANLDYFTGPFHIGVALHACGVATDMVVEHCIQARAAFVVSPCCYGFVQNTLKFSFPRSKKFQDTLSYKEHMVLCRFADQTAAQLPPERRLIGKQCMGLVDLDRSWCAEASGYSVRVMTMVPESCSPKNNMLVGTAMRRNTDTIPSTTEEGRAANID
uniref:Glutathione S-transferase C-terminal domain-containing protein n=1 Tax=Gadus morhua TaxID=8049 RepID=A0A8C5B9V3_GADMO